MRTREEAIAACMQLADAYEDYPFHDENWTAMRHRTNKKCFAYIFERNGRIWINLKAEPQWADFWKSAHSAVLPGFHMNKAHWISVILDGSMSDDQIFPLILDSYHLTQSGQKKGRDEASRR